MKVERLEAQMDSDSVDAKVRSVVKEYKRKMARLQGAHDAEAAAVREAADAEVSKGRKELSDQVSYLNQELQVCRHWGESICDVRIGIGGGGGSWKVDVVREIA